MCDPREQTGRGSPAGRGGSKWQPKTRCGVFVPREHNLAPFCFRTRESAAFDINSRTVRNPGVAKTSARKRSRTGKRQEVHVAARRGSMQRLARTDRGMQSSNQGRRATDGRWSALQWGAVEGMNGVVMVGGFCVVSRITASASALFHHGARLRFLAGSCAGGLAAGICTKKALESSDPRARIVCYSAAGRRLRSRTARIPDSG